MLELNKMNDEMLMMVSGGNYHDCGKDTDPNKSWYEVGQLVEAFSTVFHITTMKVIITQKMYKYGFWFYRFKFPNSKTESKCWFDADIIER